MTQRLSNRTLQSLLLMSTLVLSACASRAPAPDWQGNAQGSMDRSIAAYLEGNGRVEIAEFERARSEIARTGRIDLLARIELMRCAGRVASLVVDSSGACPAFQSLRPDASAPERAYADYLDARLAPQDVSLLPAQHRAIAASAATSISTTGEIASAPVDAALQSINDPLARLVAAGVLFRQGRASPAVISNAIDTASAQGWPRPLLAWLHVQLQRVGAAGASDEAERLRRRITLVEQPGGLSK